MLSVSNAAMQHLHQSLTSIANSEAAGKCFRIVPKENRYLTLSLAEPAPSDKTFEFEGDTVLALPQELKTFCSDKSLDLDENGKLELS